MVDIKAKLSRPAHADAYWPMYAHGVVACAIKNGFLPRLNGVIACTDCGKPAEQYDHRDYGRPLDVEPVCRGCNRRRGPAIWPMRRDFPLVSEKASTKKAA